MASSGITVLITGAGRGIGFGLAAQYLEQPGNTVIAAVRDPTAAGPQSLATLPRGAATTLITVTLDASSAPSIAAAVESLSAAHGIASLDVVIANAGASFGAGRLLELGDDNDAAAAAIQQNVELNSYGPLRLLQATRRLLRASAKAPRFAAVSSAMGSLGLLPYTGALLLGPYALSKTLLNAVVKRVALEEEGEGVLVLALDPGMVSTEGAWASIKSVGMEDRFQPVSIEESAFGLVKVIAQATKEQNGHFLKYTGEETPW